MSTYVNDRTVRSRGRSVWMKNDNFQKFIVNNNIIIKLLVTVFKFLGLAPITVKTPYSFRASENYYYKDFVFAKCVFGLIYNCGLIIVTFGIAYITLPLLNGNHDDKDLLQTFRIVKTVVGVLVMLTIWLVVALRYKSALKIVNKIVDMDNELMVIQDLHYLETSKRRIAVLFVLNYILWISIFTLQLLATADKGKSVKLWIARLLPNLVMNWYIMQYVMMLLIMEDRFISVNRGFVIISKSNATSFLNADIMPTNSSERTIVNNFMALRRARAVFSDICRDISEYYALPILLAIAFFCGAIIYHSYYLVIPFIVSGNDEPMLNNGIMVCWLMMEILPTMLLAVCVTRVLNEMNTTSGTVYKVLAHSVLNYVANDELKKFSFELLHENVHFTAYGIFSLDCTLVQSIVGMLATYLIILIQFQINNSQEHANVTMKTTDTT